MSKKWDANEEMGRWWEDREDEFGMKLTLVRARLEEALYGEERLATTALAEARLQLIAIHALSGHHETRSMLALHEGSVRWKERWWA